MRLVSRWRASIFAVLMLVVSSHLLSEETDRVSTGMPFAPGDILVASTLMDDPDDDHAGTGRLLQYDKDLNLKGVLWITGTGHKIGGLNFAPDGTLWGFSQLTPSIFEVAPSGKQRPIRKFSNRTLSSVTFGADGSLYFGEHLQGTETGHPSVTTKFKTLPGTDRVGDGNIYKYSADGKLLRTFEADTHGGMFGFLAVTSTVLADDDARMIYISETGNRVMQYDLENDRQLPDLAVFEDDPRVPMVITMSQLPDGRLMLTTGGGLILLHPDSGEIRGFFELEGKPGWAAVAPSADGQFALIGNFFTGDIIKIRLDDGQVVARNNVGQKESLSGVAQFPG